MNNQNTALTPQKRRPRKFAEWRVDFIDALRTWGNVSHACEIAGVSRATVYKRRSGNARFAAQWDDALEEATDALEREARRRAVQGVARPQFYQGEPILVPAIGANGRPMIGMDGEPIMVQHVEHQYSDTLLIFLLKAHRPEKFRDRRDITSGGEPLTAPITVIDFGLDDDAPPDSEDAA